MQLDFLAHRAPHVACAKMVVLATMESKDLGTAPALPPTVGKTAQIPVPMLPVIKVAMVDAARGTVSVVSARVTPTMGGLETHALSGRTHAFSTPLTVALPV